MVNGMMKTCLQGGKYGKVPQLFCSGCSADHLSMKVFKSLNDFFERLNRTADFVAKSRGYEQLEVSVMLIEIPLICSDTIQELTFFNIDDYDVFSGDPIKSIAVGLSKKLGIWRQIQNLLEIIVNTCSRDALRQSSGNVQQKNGFVLQKNIDSEARHYVQKVVNSFSSESRPDVLEEFIIHCERHIHIVARKIFFTSNNIRKQRCVLYQEMYDNFAFVREVVDRMVALICSNPKIGVSGFESYSNTLYRRLDTIFRQMQVRKYFNHLLRDCLVHGDGFLVFQPFYDEVAAHLLRPANALLINGLLRNESNNDTYQVNEYFHLHLLNWDSSGYGISMLEPLASQYLHYKYFMHIAESLRKAAGTLYVPILSRTLQTQEKAKSYAISILNEMKATVKDPTSDYHLTTDNLFF